MLPKSLRLTQKFDYNRVRKYGKSVSFPLFTLGYLKTNEPTTKFGIIITNKIDKRATERHRVKRILTELISKNLTKFGKGQLIVFVARSSIVGKKYEEIESVFNQAISKIPFS